MKTYLAEPSEEALPVIEQEPDALIGLQCDVSIADLAELEPDSRKSSSSIMIILNCNISFSSEERPKLPSCKAITRTRLHVCLFLSDCKDGTDVE